jgi:hypothetical protein
MRGICVPDGVAGPCPRIVRQLSTASADQQTIYFMERAQHLKTRRLLDFNLISRGVYRCGVFLKRTSIFETNLGASGC